MEVIRDTGAIWDTEVIRDTGAIWDTEVIRDTSAIWDTHTDFNYPITWPLIQV